MMQGVAPPLSSLVDDRAGWAPPPGPEGSPGMEQDAADVASVSLAWKHLKGVSGRDETRHADLYDLLASNLREVQYTQTPPDWPPQLEPTSAAMSEMPEIVLRRHAAGQAVAFCGVFPELRRAWASVDNSLFLWRYDCWQDVPLEYTGEEQSIVSVGLAPVKPDVFVTAIERVLVICTTTEITLVGVCGGAPAGSVESPELALAPLPLYTTPADDVTVTCVTSTTSGRIFLGGADGHLYELQYRGSSTPGGVLGAVAGRWRGGRHLSKVCVTAGLRSALPSLLPSFLAPVPSPVVEVVVDNERHLLYSRTADHRLVVHDLGADGALAAPRLAAECGDVFAEATKAAGGREAFARSAGGAGAAPAPALAAMVVIPLSESRHLALVTVTAEGQRMFWSVHRAGTGAGSSEAGSRPGTRGPGPRPDRLHAEFVRTAPLLRAAVPRTSAGGGGAPQFFERPGRGSPTVSAAASAGGTLVVAGSAGGSTHLTSFARDTSLAPLRPTVGASLGAGGPLWYRESLAELPRRVPGDVCALLPSPPRGEAGAPARALGEPTASPLSLAGMIACAHASLRPRPRFALCTTAGVLEVERLRPIDTLAAVLEGGDGRRLDAVVRALGPIECAALCVVLAGLGSARSGALVPASPPVAARARAVLADARLAAIPGAHDAAVPGAHEPGSSGVASLALPLPGSAGPLAPAAGAPAFDMGAPVPVTEREWTATHRGLCLAVSRLLQPAVWDEPLFVAAGGGAALLRCAIADDALALLESQLERLARLAADLERDACARADAAAAPGTGTGGAVPAAFSVSHAAATTAAAAARRAEASREEAGRTRAVAALLSRAAQACFLLRTLSENNVGRLVARGDASSLDASLRAQLLALRFRDWVAGADGDAAATALVACLLGEHAGNDGVAANLTALLREGCPALFREDDRVYYRGLAALVRAEAAAVDADRAQALEEAGAAFCAVPSAVDLWALAPRLARLGDWGGLRAVTLRKAAAALERQDAAADDAAAACAAAVKPAADVLRVVIGGAQGPLLSSLPPSVATPAWIDLEASLAARATGSRSRQAAQFLEVASAPAAGQGADDRAAVALREALYGAMLDAGAASELPRDARSAAGVEAFLIRAGGLAGVSQASQIPALDRRQVAALSALAKIYTSQEAHLKAAQAYEIIADVPSALGAGGVEFLTLDQRAEHLDAAVLQARSAGDAILLEQLASKARVLAVQRRILKLLLADEDAQVDEHTLLTLRASPRPLAELYNDVAVPHQLWSCCLEMVIISSYGDAIYVMKLWDLCLKAAWERGWAAAIPDSEMDDPHLAALEGLEAMAEEVETLAIRAGATDENSFPLAHLALRLEQAAAGLWPIATELELETTRPATVITTAARGSVEAALRVYELLLGDGASVVGDDAACTREPSFRLRLLESGAYLLSATGSDAAQQYRTAGPDSKRELASHLASCTLLATQARRLGEPGAELAARFDAVADGLRAGSKAAMGGAGYSVFAATLS